MSLLLKALKQAEKGGAGPPKPPEPPDLDLEPLTLATPKPRPQWVDPSDPGTPDTPRMRLSLPRLGLVPTTALVALLVALGYGIYVYRALHPASIAATPPAAPRRAAAPSPPPAPELVHPPPQSPLAAVLPPVPAPSSSSGPAAPRAHPAPLAVPGAEHSATRAAAAHHTLLRPTAQPALIGTTASPLDAGYAAWRAGRLDEAQALYAHAAAHDGGAQAWLGLASIASLRGNMREADGDYEKVLQLDPTNATAQAALLDSLGASDAAAAEAHLQELIRQQPSAFLYFALGNLYAGQQRWADAEAAYFQARARAPDNADFTYNLAVSLDHLQQYAAALNHYRAALKLAGPHTRFDLQAAQSRIAQLTGK